MNDSDLVQGLRDQDPAAVRHLTECYLPSVWRFVYARVNGDRHLAEDIVSESVLALMQAAATGAAIENPMAWLRTVASNKVHDHFRAAARVRHLIEQVKHTRDSVEHSDASKQQEESERRVEVRQTMDDLPESYRLALEWKYVEKLSVREISGRMAMSEKAVESILFRARREFRGKFAAREKREEYRAKGVLPGCRPDDGHPPDRAAAEETAIREQDHADGVHVTEAETANKR